MIVGILVSILLVSSLLVDAYAQENGEEVMEPEMEEDLHPEEHVIMEQLAYDGKIKVQLEWPEVYPKEVYSILVRILDAQTNEPFDKVSFSVVVYQNDEVIESYPNFTATNGTDVFEVEYLEEGPSQILVRLWNVEDGEDILNVKGEKVFFSVVVVPEFPFALVVMVLSMIMILVLTKTHPITRIRSL